MYRCALGRGGIVLDKVEGDGGTPAGAYPAAPRALSPDRLAAARHRPAGRGNRAGQGWCDDPAHPDYNRQVQLPFSASHEELWREDASTT